MSFLGNSSFMSQQQKRWHHNATKFGKQKKIYVLLNDRRIEKQILVYDNQTQIEPFVRSDKIKTTIPNQTIRLRWRKKNGVLQKLANKLFSYYNGNDCQSFWKYKMKKMNNVFFLSSCSSFRLVVQLVFKHFIALLTREWTTATNRKIRRKKKRIKAASKKIEKFLAIYWHHVGYLTAPCGINRSRLRYAYTLFCFSHLIHRRCTVKSSDKQM